MNKIYYSNDELSIIYTALGTTEFSSDDLYTEDLNFIRNNCIKKLNARFRYWCQLIDAQNGNDRNYYPASVYFRSMQFPNKCFIEGEDTIEISGRLYIVFRAPQNLVKDRYKRVKSNYTFSCDPYKIIFSVDEFLNIKRPSAELLHDCRNYNDCTDLREFWRPIIDKALCEQVDWEGLYKAGSEYIDELFLDILDQ